MRTKIVGVIDIGSNTIRLSLFKSNGETVRNISNEKATAGLAGYRKDGSLTKEGIDVLIYTLRGFLSLTSNFEEIETLYPFATASLRNINNTEEVLERVKEELGIEIEIIEPKMEAYLSYLGASVALDEHTKGILTDIGGGSSEVVIFDKKIIVDATSIEIGSLSVYKDIVEGLFLTSDDKKRVKKIVKTHLTYEGFDKYQDREALCGVGGSARATLRMYNHFYSMDPNNMVMDFKKLKELLHYLIDMEPKQKMDLILKVKADRIHTLLPGMSILYEIAKYFSVPQISVSNSGVREGYVYYKEIADKKHAK